MVTLRDGYSWVWVGNGRLAHIVRADGPRTLCGRQYTETDRFRFVSKPYACRACLGEYRRLEAARCAAIQDADDEERLWPSGPDLD